MKSSAKAKLEAYRWTFFLVGLVLSLFAVLTTLEFKVYDSSNPVVECDLPTPYAGEVIPPVTNYTLPEPPRPKVAIAEIPQINQPNLNNLTIVLNDAGLIDDPDFSNAESIPLIPGDDALDSVPVDILSLDRFPLFDQCVSLASNEEKSRCFEEVVRSKISSELRVRPSYSGETRTKFYVEFIVGLDGRFTVTKLFNSPSANVEMQVKEIMEGMPHVEPAIAQGRHRAMKMVLPITIVYN